MWEWKYVLAPDGKTPIPEPDVEKWAPWFENPQNRRVAFTKVGLVEVSTVFLGIDHNLNPHTQGQKPVLWETMIFGAKGDLEHYQERYSSYDDAVLGHECAVWLVMQRQTKQ